jgi:hypothetical protein
MPQLNTIGLHYRIPSLPVGKVTLEVEIVDSGAIWIELDVS